MGVPWHEQKLGTLQRNAIQGGKSGKIKGTRRLNIRCRVSIDTSAEGEERKKCHKGKWDSSVGMVLVVASGNTTHIYRHLQHELY